MDHLDVERAHLLLQGRLTAEDQRKWEGHLRECERCRALVESERAFQSVLDLGREPDQRNVEATYDLPPAEQPAELPLATRGEQLWRTVLLGAGLVINVALAVLLIWQLGRATAGESVDRVVKGIPAGLERRVVSNMDALVTLERDPWLIDEFGAVETLDRLIADPPNREVE